MENENAIPILEEVKEKAIKNDDGKPTHILIEGDNYHALQCLNYTHRSKVDVIYIDPPYNTGSTKTEKFVYKDSRFLKEYPDGKVIAKDDPCRHSSWLSFMNKRLKLAKNLLSEKGVIFISIDDNEQANLKLLCDQVFGEKNFVGVFFRKTKTMTGDDGCGLNIQHEYLTVYSKDKKNVFFEGDVKNFDIYSNPDNDPHGEWCSSDPSAKSGGDSTYFPIENPYTKQVDFPPKGRYWAFSKTTLQDYIKSGRLKFKEKYSKNQRGFIFKRYKENLSSYKNAVDTFSFSQNDYLNEVATKELNHLLGAGVFSYPKPLIFAKDILRYSSNKSSTILDFFAGSGTTMHATMQLNAEDGGHRQCILVQAPETTWEIKDGVKQAKENSVEAFKAGFNTISDITYERNRRIIEGYTNAKGEHVEGLGNSLKYYKTAFVGERSAKSALDEDRMALAAKAGCLIALAENSLETVECNGKDFYQIFTDEKQKYTCVYFNGDYSEFSEFVKEIENIRSKNKRAKFNVYAFSWGSGDDIENEFDDLRNVNIKPIPAPILDIYKTLNA